MAAPQGAFAGLVGIPGVTEDQGNVGIDAQVTRTNPLIGVRKYFTVSMGSYA